MNLLEIIEIRDKLRAELATVEKFLEIARARGHNGSAQPAEVKPDAARPNPKQGQLRIPGTDAKYGAVAEVVREGLRLCPNKYTINDVEAVLEKLGKPLAKLQIATALTRFARRGEIFVHRKGKGRKATTYKNENAPPAQ
jgi:hypothetical protein